MATRSTFKIGELSYATFIARNEMADVQILHRDGKVTDDDYRKAIETYCRLRLKLVKRRTKSPCRKRKSHSNAPLDTRREIASRKLLNAQEQ